MRIVIRNLELEKRRIPWLLSPRKRKYNEDINNILQREIIIATEDNNRSTGFHAFNVGFYLSISICVLYSNIQQKYGGAQREYLAIFSWVS